MELTKRKAGDILIVSFSKIGPLDSSNIGPFSEMMANLIEKTSNLLIDIGKVTFLDSSGLGALVAIWKSVSTKNGKLKLCRIDPSVRTVFEVTRINRLIEIYDTEEEALASYQTGSDRYE